MAPLIGEIYPTTKLLFICKEFIQPSCCSYARNFSRNPGQIKNRTVQGGSCKTNIAVSLDVISERGGWILHFTFHMLHVTHPTLPHFTRCYFMRSAISVTRYTTHITPQRKRGQVAPRYVTLHPTEPTNCPINTSWRQPLLRQEIVAWGWGRCIEGNNEQESAEWLNAYKPPHNGHLGQQGSTLMSQSLGGKVFFVKMSYDFSIAATTGTSNIVG